MPKWEYEVIEEFLDSPSWDRDNEIKSILNKYGEQGWECISYDLKITSEGSQLWTAVFKRKVE
jgi:hypothetical protein